EAGREANLVGSVGCLEIDRRRRRSGGSARQEQVGLGLKLALHQPVHAVPVELAHERADVGVVEGLEEVTVVRAAELGHGDPLDGLLIENVSKRSCILVARLDRKRGLEEYGIAGIDGRSW